MRYPKEAIVFEVHYPNNSYWDHRCAEGIEILGSHTVRVWSHDIGEPPAAPAVSLVNCKPLTPAAREFLKAAKAGR